jgi:hypothetical protein
MRPAKRQKRNAVEAIDNAGAEPARAPDPSLALATRERGEVKAVGPSFPPFPIAETSLAKLEKI